MQARKHFSTNSAFSEGWVVSCTCGAKKDDGRPMIECEDCKVWQHTRCLLGKGFTKAKLPQHFVCGDCRRKTVEKLAAFGVWALQRIHSLLKSAGCWGSRAFLLGQCISESRFSQLLRCVNDQVWVL